MKRVLHIVNNKMSYGGIETLLMNVYRNIDKNKIQFDFAVTSKDKGEYDDEIIKMGGRIFYVPSRRKSLLNYEREWEKFLMQHKNEFDTIHMHVSSLTDITPIKVAKSLNIKNIFIHSHNTFQRGTIHNILNIIHRINIEKYANKLFACSSEAGMYCFKNKKFELIRNGINSEDYVYNEKKRTEIRRKLNIPKGALAFVHIGRFSKQKNHDFLIDIFEEIHKKNNEALLFLIGDGELKNAIEEKVKTLNLQDNVKFMGVRNDVKELLQAMDIFLLPSLHEGLPVVGIEAQAAGLPIFTSNTVSPELKITELVHFYSLKDTPKIWAKNISACMKDFIRKDMQDEIINSGYDIKNTTQILEKYYLS